MNEYDGAIIQHYADTLYSRAAIIVAVYTILGGLIGLMTGPLVTAVFPSNSGVFRLVFVLMLGAIGYWIGLSKAFLLKLQAQTALCQMKIEENTR